MEKVKRKKKKRRNSVKDLPTNREQMYTGRRLSLTERLRDINKRRPSPVKIKQENKQRRRNGDLLSKSFVVFDRYTRKSVLTVSMCFNIPNLKASVMICES